MIYYNCRQIATVQLGDSVVNALDSIYADPGYSLDGWLSADRKTGNQFGILTNHLVNSAFHASGVGKSSNGRSGWA